MVKWLNSLERVYSILCNCLQKYGFTFGETKTQQPTIFRQQVLRVRKPVQQAGELSLATEPVSPGVYRVQTLYDLSLELEPSEIKT